MQTPEDLRPSNPALSPQPRWLSVWFHHGLPPQQTYSGAMWPVPMLQVHWPQCRQADDTAPQFCWWRRVQRGCAPKGQCALH